MKIAIISDSHDNLINLDKCLKYLQQQDIKFLIHCGDIATLETLQYLRDNFKGKIYACLGNMDINPEELAEQAKTFKQVEFFEDYGEIIIDNLKMLFTHKPEDLKKYLVKIQVDWAFYGHTHKPWIEKLGQTILLNPGTLAGMFSYPTFAVLDTNTQKPELILVDKL